MQLQHLKIIITGAAKGMGAHFATRLHEAGAQVAANGTTVLGGFGQHKDQDYVYIETGIKSITDFHLENGDDPKKKLRENAAEVHALLDTYARVLLGTDSGPRIWHELRVLNQVGVTRGTLEFE